MDFKLQMYDFCSHAFSFINICYNLRKAINLKRKNLYPNMKEKKSIRMTCKKTTKLLLEIKLREILTSALRTMV
jgi:hypothetical protein